MTRADLPTLKRYIGVTSATDDLALADCLAASTAWVSARVCPDPALADADPADPDYDPTESRPEVVQAINLLASRLFHRRNSPEGVSGFGGDGAVVRVLGRDPDVRALLERHYDYGIAGIG